jgi:DNA-binding transcriptional LysR family regulator
MELRQIRYALAVARERSFTRAAQRLHVSQSAVSEQVAKLEEELGFEIFARVGHSIELTDAGRTFLTEAERVAGEFQGLARTAERLRGRRVESIALGMGSGLAQVFIPRLFPTLSERAPGLRLTYYRADEEHLPRPARRPDRSRHRDRDCPERAGGPRRSGCSSSTLGAGRIPTIVRTHGASGRPGTLSRAIVASELIGYAKWSWRCSPTSACT